MRLNLARTVIKWLKECLAGINPRQTLEWPLIPPWLKSLANLRARERRQTSQLPSLKSFTSTDRLTRWWVRRRLYLTSVRTWQVKNEMPVLSSLTLARSTTMGEIGGIVAPLSPAPRVSQLNHSTKNLAVLSRSSSSTSFHLARQIFCTAGQTLTL